MDVRCPNKKSLGIYRQNLSLILSVWKIKKSSFFSFFTIKEVFNFLWTKEV